MIRLLAALGAFLFLSLWFLGEDHGQVIHAPQPRVQVVAVPQAKRPVFIPAQPVMQASEAAPVPPDVVAVSEPVSEPVSAPKVVEGRRMHTPGGASIRSGPGRGFAVIGTLVAGESVLVVDETSSTSWYQVAVQDQMGWVAARLLRE